MGLREELGLPNPIEHAAHEAVLNVVMTGEMLAKEATRVLRPLGLTDTQLNVLMLLKYQSADGSLSQTRLGRMMVVNRSNITGLVDRMEEAGWVSRRVSRHDRRVRDVGLTPAGRRLLKRAEDAYLGRIEEVMSGLSDNACEALCRMLERVREQLTGRAGRAGGAEEAFGSCCAS